MTLDITMNVTAKITIPDDYNKAYGGKKPADWSEDEIKRFKNEVAWEFSVYNLGKINHENEGGLVSDRKVVSFE